MTARIDGPGGIIAPAVLDPEWIPPERVSDWPELHEMRATHARLRAASATAANEVAAVKAQLEALVAEREAALRSSYRDESEPDLPEQDRRKDELERELATAQERAGAATGALLDFINESIERIATRREGWLGDLGKIEAERQRAVDEARRALREAERKLGATGALRHWIDRTGGIATQLPMEHIAFGAINIGAPADEARVRGSMREQLQTRTPANEPPAAVPDALDKEALYDSMLADIERQERDEQARGLRNSYA